jgi:NAD(P)-dependent dehydrogenase (short-subunit alcohol dehydrogenase family)
MSKNVLITGASGNLGKAAVEKFTNEGYTVITTVTPGKTLGFDVKDNVKIYEADLTDEQSVESVIKEIVSKHRTIDAALLLVGGFALGGIEQTDGSLLKKMFSLNFDTAYFVARPIFQQMLTQSSGGRIVFVGSRPALEAKEGKNTLAYALSKSLLFKLADYLNAEGSTKNVTASVIVPSTIDTELNRKSMPDNRWRSYVQTAARFFGRLCSSFIIGLKKSA